MNDLTKLNLTAETLPIVANELVRKVKDGEINPLDVSVQIKLMNDFEKLVKPQIAVEIINEAEKWQKQVFKYGLYPKIVTKTDYEYDDCVLDELDRQISALKEQADERKKLLKALKTTMIDPETGEEMKPAKGTPSSYVKWEK